MKLRPILYIIVSILYTMIYTGFVICSWFSLNLDETVMIDNFNVILNYYRDILLYSSICFIIYIATIFKVMYKIIADAFFMAYLGASFYMYYLIFKFLIL